MPRKRDVAFLPSRPNIAESGMTAPGKFVKFFCEIERSVFGLSVVAIGQPF